MSTESLDKMIHQQEVADRIKGKNEFLEAKEQKNIEVQRQIDLINSHID